jgi:hypothetical protein
MPAIAVLPMCSIGPASHGANNVCNNTRSASNFDGHSGSWATISMGASPRGFSLIPQRLHGMDFCRATGGSQQARNATSSNNAVTAAKVTGSVVFIS